MLSADEFDVFDPVRTRRVLIGCSISCVVLTFPLSWVHPWLGVAGVVPPLLYAWWYSRKDRRRDVAWLLQLQNCQVVSASVDAVGAHVDVWPTREEMYLVDGAGRRRTPARRMEATLRTIAVPDPTPELLTRTRRWLDDDERIEVAIRVRRRGESVRVERIDLLQGGWQHVVTPQL